MKVILLLIINYLKKILGKLLLKAQKESKNIDFMSKMFIRKSLLSKIILIIITVN